MLSSKLPNRNHNRPWRSLLVLAMALALLFIQTLNVSAAPIKVTEGEDLSSVIAVDALCVDGLVINHQEQPLEGWTVTASYVGDQGTADPQTAVSDNEGMFHFDLPLPGRWLFSIAIPSEWIAITDASFEVDVAFGSADCVQIRFKVEQQVTVIVYKIDDDHTPLEGWTIIATPGPGNTFSEIKKAVTDAEGKATFVLSPGRWVFTEEAPPDVTWWAPVIPLQGVQELNVRAPGPYTIRFKNVVKEVVNGCIRVTKLDTPPAGATGVQAEPFGLPDWPITVFRTNGTVAAEGTTNALGEITFSDLPFGPYVVKETILSGWEAVTPTTYEVILSRADEDCQEIVFQNKQKAKGICIEGEKLDANGLYGIPGWEIEAKAIEAGGFNPDPVVTDGLGKFRIDFPFDDYRIPGATYEVCEESRDGWGAVGPTCHIVTLPKYPGACAVVPPFINHQTNNEYPPPVSDYPEKKPNDHKQPNHNGGCSAYHTVKKGESIYSIAPKYNVSGQELMRANPWVRGQRHNWLYVGQQVCIP